MTECRTTSMKRLALLFVAALMLGSAAAHACGISAAPDRMIPGDCLTTGISIASIHNNIPPPAYLGLGQAYGSYVLILQPSGDLTYLWQASPLSIDASADCSIGYGCGAFLIWHTNTAGTGAGIFINQSAADGELFLDNSAQTINYWASGTTILNSVLLIEESDGALLISSPDGSTVESVLFPGYDNAW